MKRTFNCVCAIAIVVGTTQAASAQSTPYTGQFISYDKQLTSAVSSYSNKFDQSMATSWSNGDGAGNDGSGNNSCSSCNNSCDNCCGNSSCLTCRDPGSFMDNLVLFAAGDGWADHGDDDDTNNFGYHLGANSGFGGDRIRFQAGGSYGFYNLHGREDEPNDTGAETQLFLTGGLYKRSNVCAGDRWCWGAVYDYMSSQNWGEGGDDIDLSQIRGRIGYATNRTNEIGFWGAWHLNSDITPTLSSTVRVQTKNQLNIYWLHQYAYGARTMFYVGLADEPNGVNPVIRKPGLKEVVFGLRGRAPMNQWLSLYGNVLYILPGTTPGDNHNDSYAEEVWNVSFGLVFYPGAKARASTISGPAGLPLMPVADNGTFAVNTPAGNL